MTTLCQLLCNRWGGDAGVGPGPLTPGQVANLTPYQINKIYFVRRGEHGRIEPDEDDGVDPTPADPRAVFTTYCRLNGVTEPWRIARLWAERKGEILGESEGADG